MAGCSLVIAPHNAIIDTETWLACRRKLLNNHQIKTTKPKNSFLSGKVKCGCCGYSLVIKFSQRKTKDPVRYFVDTGKTYNHICNANLPTIKADEFETKILQQIKEKLDSITIHGDMLQADYIKEENKLKEKNAVIQQSIENLISAIANGTSETATDYINKKIKDFDNEKNNIQAEIQELQKRYQSDNNHKYKKLKDVMNKWNELSFDDKRDTIDLLIQKIIVFQNRIEIVWNV